MDMLTEMLTYFGMTESMADRTVIAVLGIAFVIFILVGIVLRVQKKIVFFGGVPDICVITAGVVLPMAWWYITGDEVSDSMQMHVVYAIAGVALIISLILTYQNNRKNGFSVGIALFACLYKLVIFLVAVLLIFKFVLRFFGKK